MNRVVGPFSLLPLGYLLLVVFFRFTQLVLIGRNDVMVGYIGQVMLKMPNRLVSRLVIRNW